MLLLHVCNERPHSSNITSIYISDFVIIIITANATVIIIIVNIEFVYRISSCLLSV